MHVYRSTDYAYIRTRFYTDTDPFLYAYPSILLYLPGHNIQSQVENCTETVPDHPQ